MNINNAILHVFDFMSCVNVFAQAPMDLGNKAAKRYVTSQAKRALGNLDSKRGTFAENSLFAEELRAYFRGERDFRRVGFHYYFRIRGRPAVAGLP